MMLFVERAIGRTTDFWRAKLLIGENQLRIQPELLEFLSQARQGYLEIFSQMIRRGFPD
jgi:hypothetical protein